MVKFFSSFKVLAVVQGVTLGVNLALLVNDVRRLDSMTTAIQSAAILVIGISMWRLNQRRLIWDAKLAKAQAERTMAEEMLDKLRSAKGITFGGMIDPDDLDDPRTKKH